jgi:hypothetical protein
MIKAQSQKKKIIQTNATTKQRRTMKALVENGGSVRDAMRKAGYSEAMIKTPSKLTRSKNWKELLEEILPNDFVIDQHKKLFNQKQVSYFSFPRDMTDLDIRKHVEANGLEVISVRSSDKAKMAFYAMPDTQAIKAALDMAHKLKGNYSPEKTDQTIRVVEPITGMKIVYES